MAKDMSSSENTFETVDKLTGKRVVYLMADKNCEKYAHRLQTLISAKHNVKCCIYSKEVYKANMSRVSSDNVIIFIGENDISSAALPNLKNQAPEDYGLCYGWYGKRAKISRTMKMVNFKKHNEFIEYYNKLCADFEKQIKPYNLKDFAVGFAMLPGFGIISLEIAAMRMIVKKSLIDKNLQYNACIMDFYKNGLDQFIEGAFNG